MNLWTAINLTLALLLTVGVSAVAVLVPWRLDRRPAPSRLPDAPRRMAAATHRLERHAADTAA